MYPVAVTLLPIRLVLFVLMLFLPFLTFKILYLGQDTSKPISSIKRIVAQNLYSFFSRLNLLAIGIVVRRKDIQFDYSKWLGHNYKAIESTSLSTYVANHMGFADEVAVIVALLGNCSFLAAEKTKNVPFIGEIVRMS